MDEAGRIIVELQERLAQLDHKIWLYHQDMAFEFKKYADGLLRDVPDDVSITVNKAIAESLIKYPLLDLGKNDSNKPSPAVTENAVANCIAESVTTPPNAVPVSPLFFQRPDSDVLQNLHEREEEFRGLFTPSYLPLLDSTDRNERRSSSRVLSPASETEAMNILARERSMEDTSTRSSSYPISSLSLRNTASLRRRSSTDESSLHSDQSDTPTIRSALRRKSSESKPQSPRRVRFEFEGEEFPTTSSPKLESSDSEMAPHVEPIILGYRDDVFYDGGSDQLGNTDESLPPKRVSSSQALRALSRGPVEDDGTQWTEVRAPPDGSASVPSEYVSSEESDDEEGLNMQPMSVTAAARRSNGSRQHLSGLEGESRSMASASAAETGLRTTSAAESSTTIEKSSADIAEEEDMLSDLPPLKSFGSQRPFSTISSAALESKYADKAQSMKADLSSSIDLSPDETDNGGKLESIFNTQAQDEEDDDDLFAFDDAPERSQQPHQPELDSESGSDLDSPTSDALEEDIVNLSHYATSPALGIVKPGMLGSQNTTIISKPVAAPSSSHRSSFHPFNTPIVSEAIHTQAASLGHVPSFVGSVKNGLDEDVLQSFRGGSFKGGAPRSLSEKMAFDDAMETQRQVAKKR